MEYENEKIQRLGSVVTNNGYSDWACIFLLRRQVKPEYISV